MNDWPYSEIVKKHFLHPQNFLRDGEKFTADGVGEVGSPACGDVMKMWIQIKNDRITDLRWKTFGCASALAATSMLSKMVLEKKGMKIADALKITPKDILKRLGGLPQNKIHCSVLGDKALRAAIENYREQKGAPKKDTPKIICSCLGVSERELDLAIAAGDRTFEEFQKRTKAGTGCGRCIEKIKKMLAEKIDEYSDKSCCDFCQKKCPQKK
ncbi:MAG: iron-sulfur cluster assembly scaffold protein [Candidatus Peribacteraceae bacterium]|nr:iron-sulfur cluster assembly scaffold protein [Candidatus Peribacteraceae bacterium]